MAVSSKLIPTDIKYGGTGATTASGAAANLGFTQNIQVVNTSFKNFQAGTLYFVVSGSGPNYTPELIHFEE